MIKHLLLVVFLFGIYESNAKPKAGIDTVFIDNLLSRSYDLEETLPDSSFHLAEKALDLSSKCNYQRGIAKAYMRMGNILFTKGQINKSIHYIKSALSIRESINDYGTAAGSCITLSQIYSTSGKKDSSFYVLFEALRLNKLSNDSLSLANTYLTLGTNSEQYGDSRKSLEYYLKAEQISKLKNDAKGLELSCSGLGFHYFEEGSFYKALSYFLKADEILNQLHSPFDRATNLNNIAACYEKLNDFKKARNIYFQALLEYKKLGMKNDIALCFGNIGSLFINNNQPDSAIQYLSKSILIAREVNDMQIATISIERLSKAYFIKHDFAKAYNYHVQYSLLSDSLLNNEKVKQIAEMQTKYKTNEIENNLKLANKDIEKQAAINAEETKRQRTILISVLIGLFLVVIFSVFMFNRWRVTQKQKIIITKEKQRSDELLRNILPDEVAEELKAKGEAEARLFDNVTVLFTDFVGFTTISEKLTPKELVAEIHHYFTAFDGIIERNGLEKIKTIGDAYLAVCGVPNPDKEHAKKTVRAAIEIMEFITKHETEGGKFNIRCGINTGSVVAGIVGVKKFAYDIWGDTVNTAARMEQNSKNGKINISESTYQLVKDDFNCVHRGKVQAKNKGEIDMYFVEGESGDIIA